MTTSIALLKNLVKVANHTGKIEDMSHSKVGSFRKIEIKVSYSPILDKANDIFPYWKLEMKEEEFQKTIILNGKQINEVKDIYNGFISQGLKESYIQDNLLPY